MIRIELNNVIALNNTGKTRKEIGEHYGLSKTDCARLFRHPKLKNLRPNFVGLIKESEVVDLIEKGLTRPQIAEKMGIKISSLNQFFKENKHLRFKRAKKQPAFELIESEETAKTEETKEEYVPMQFELTDEHGDDVTPVDEGEITGQTDVMAEELPFLPEDKVSPPKPHVPLPILKDAKHAWIPKETKRGETIDKVSEILIAASHSEPPVQEALRKEADQAALELIKEVEKQAEEKKTETPAPPIKNIWKN